MTKSTAGDIQAVIMAGGEGSRLRPLTSNMPKPMLPVVDRPMMEHIIGLLRRHGFTDVVATVQFLASVIRNYFADGSDQGVSLSYTTEEEPLGTAGSVLQAREFLDGTFLVISGDALTDLDLTAAIEFHRTRDAVATLVLKRVPDPLEFGIVMMKEDGAIDRFLEKPTWGQVFSDTINTGIYVLEPDVLDLIPPDQPYDFSSELFPLMLDKGLPVFGYVTDAYWTDVGTTDAYLHAHRDVLSRAVDVDIPGFELRPNVWVGEDVDVHPTAHIEGPAYIGDNCRIGPGVVIGAHTSIGQNSILGAEAVVAQSVVMDGTHVGPFARMRGSILGRGASIEQGGSIEEGSVLGDEVVIGAGAIVKPRVKIYPAKTVEAGAIVTHSVVRDRRATRSLFGPRGVSGIVNVGITPTVAVRLGMAYGSMLRRGNTVVTGRDASRAARTIKRALIAGLNSTGVHCRDLELSPMPLTRFTVRGEQAAGGVSVRTSPKDSEIVEIRFFDGEGGDLPETEQRKLERLYFREDYRRAGPARIGEIEFPPRAVEQYAAGLIRSVDIDAIRRSAPKVVVDYGFGPASLIAPTVLGRLGCEVLAVNSFTDENRPVLVAADIQRLLGGLSEHVRNSGSDLGVLLEPGGEIAHLVDNRGRVVGHEQALLAFLRHETKLGVDQVALSLACSTECQRVVESGGGSVRWTPVTLPSLMSFAAESDVGFAGNAEGVLIFPSFMPAPDALMTFAKALELISVADRSLSAIVEDLPRTFIARRDVPTPWDLRGAVMRHVASVEVPGRLVLLDGVKVVEEQGWALVIPLPDEPACRVWAEGRNDDHAQELLTRYAALVEDVAARPQVTS
ncbi:MAG: NTP transferase domain-containing protein [Actinobacteria bacterium]|nr:NTP transferase domain-containing protein [Actinomycetota bacterium]